MSVSLFVLYSVLMSHVTGREQVKELQLLNEAKSSFVANVRA